MTDRSVSSASFYEPPFQYKEENTMLLYQNIKMVRGYIYSKKNIIVLQYLSYLSYDKIFIQFHKKYIYLYFYMN